jgi:hypothetical protein
MLMSFRGDRFSFFAIAAWLTAIVAAFGYLVVYEQTPGATTKAAAGLPSGLDLPAKSGTPLLLMFLHPRCACSRASVGELEKIYSRAPQAAEVCLYFYRPKDKPDSWTQTGLYETARRNGWTVRIDEDGAMARRLGAETSGHVMIFDGTGSLRFSGGVTAARGHWGDNESAGTALKTLVEKPADVSNRPVFGCDIQGETPARSIGSGPDLKP